MDDLDRLKKLAGKQRQLKGKIEGKLESRMEELEEEGFSSVPEATKSMKALKVKIDKMEKVFNSKIKNFREQYADQLQKIS